MPKASNSNPSQGNHHVAPSTGVAISACAFELQGGQEMQLLPAGKFRASPPDNRPTDVPFWYIDAAAASQLIAKIESRISRLPIDYEHQTLLAKENGKPAPRAGGWLKMEWREGKGLYAVDVDWTENASRMIAAKEYLYSSPVFLYDKKTGRVTDLIMAAITNNPALDGLDELTLKVAASFCFNDHTGDDSMLQKLLEMLGLKSDATETEAVAALTAVIAKAGKVDEHATEIASLTQRLEAAGNPDPAKFVPIESVTNLQQQLATLTQRINGDEVERVIADAVLDGKLAGLEDWARDLGNKDIAALKAFVEKAPVMAALKGTQTRGNSPQKQTGELTEDQLAVCARMGISVEDFKAANGIGTEAA